MGGEREKKKKRLSPILPKRDHVGVRLVYSLFYVFIIKLLILNTTLQLNDICFLMYSIYGDTLYHYTSQRNVCIKQTMTR